MATHVDPHTAEREALVRQLEVEFRATAALTGRPRLDERIAEALRRVPRHRFVPTREREAAYANAPLPIGSGQTISQPYIVALMSDLLEVEPGARVLEIGTGSGYQAAILAELGAQVYSLEIIPELADRAAQLLAELGYANVRVGRGDGYSGWPEHAPYDGIVVTAAAAAVPAALEEQLADGGRLVIPIGSRGGNQVLRLIRRVAANEFQRTEILPVAFVPFTREADPAREQRRE